MTALDPRPAIARRAAAGARAALDAAQPRLRTGRRTQQAIDALGAPHADLLERVDDALYSLKKGSTQ